LSIRSPPREVADRFFVIAQSDEAWRARLAEVKRLADEQCRDDTDDDA
jgi:hypothetical protein